VKYADDLVLMAKEEKERIFSFEGGSSRSHYVEEPFW
jgi:hypothetical protein